MKINENNCTQYFIRYLDKKLTPGEELELFAFLAANPGIDKQLDLLDEVRLIPENITYPDKNSLKKSVSTQLTKEEFYCLCVLRLENMISTEESLTLDDFLNQYPEFQKDAELFESVKLKADKDVVFDSKETLKRVEITAQEFDNLCIELLEGVIGPDNYHTIKNYIKQNPGSADNLNTFRKTKLKPDLSVRYPGKAFLKKKDYTTLRRNIIRWSVSAAAAVILVLAVNYYFAEQSMKGYSAGSFSLSSKIDGKFNNSNKNSLFSVQNVSTANQFNVKKNVETVASKSDSTVSFADAVPNTVKQTTDSANIIQVKVVEKEAPQIAGNNLQPGIEELYNYVFAETRYSHFREIIEAVPYDDIQPTASGLSGIGIWDIIEAGETGINKVTNADLKIKKDSGKKTDKFLFSIGKFSFSRTKSK